MNFAGLGALSLALAVGLGAFGAHALRTRLDEYATGLWEKGVLYQLVHSAGLLVVPLLSRAKMLPSTAADRICYLLATGILLFSGSLYTIALTGARSAGAIAPFGGTAFLAGWLYLAFALFRNRP